MITKDFWKELKSLDLKKDNYERIICLLYILDSINKSKNKEIYRNCKTIDEAIKDYIDASNFTDMLRNSCNL